MSEDCQENKTPTGLRRAIRNITNADSATDNKNLLNSLAAIIATVALGVGGYASGKFLTHETSIAVLQSDNAQFKEILKEQKDADREQNTLLREILQRLPRNP